MPSRAYQTMLRYNRLVAELEAQQALEMANRWKPIEDRLWKYIQAVLDEVETTGSLTQMQILQLSRYQDLVRMAQAEIGRFEAWASTSITEVQKKTIDLGIQSAIEAVAGTILPTYVNTIAVSSMVGLCADGQPLFSLLSKRALFPDAIEKLTAALIEGVALGFNPRKTALAMANNLAQGLTKALTIARTEQLRSFREASREQYQAAGVKQYQRHCAKSDRTCLACLGLDGKLYPTRDEFDSHPNCRCFTVPVIPGEESDRASAQEWFAELAPERQVLILGRGHYELYRTGTPLSDMVAIRNDPVWGPTIGIKPVRSFVVDQA